MESPMIKQITPFKRARFERGLLAVDVAAAARIHPSRLSNIENARVAARDDEVRRLARALGVAVDVLAGGAA
jgi:transcriptional regulator with XRE-family HTH domain